MIDRKYFKTEEIYARADFLCFDAYALMATMIAFLLKRNIKPMITETVSTAEEDLALKRISSSHRDCRAFDIRCKDWTPEQKEEFIGFFEIHFGHLGALRKDGSQILVVNHGDGNENHMHVQLKKSFIDQSRIASFKQYIKRVT